MSDPVLDSQIVTKFINCLMHDGKKSVAEKVVYGALTEAAIRSKLIDAKAKKDEEGGSTGSAGKSTRISSSSRKAVLVKLSDKNKKSVLDLFEKVLDKLKPTIEVRPRRVGGATYQVPVEVPMVRRIALAMGWLIESSRGRSEKGMMSRLMICIVWLKPIKHLRIFVGSTLFLMGYSYLIK
jgi:small subunit ribosomal protein S7